jgi:hypothetical protein
MLECSPLRFGVLALRFSGMQRSLRPMLRQAHWHWEQLTPFGGGYEIPHGQERLLQVVC